MLCFDLGMVMLCGYLFCFDCWVGGLLALVLGVVLRFVVCALRLFFFAFIVGLGIICTCGLTLIIVFRSERVVWVLPALSSFFGCETGWFIACLFLGYVFV